MSILPMETSSFSMRKSVQMVDKLEERQKSTLFNRQNSYRNSEEEARSHSGNSNKIEGKKLNEFADHINQNASKIKSKSLVTKIVENIYFQIFITILTVVTLFLYDFKTIFLTKSQDFTVGIFNLIFIGIFMIQICMNIKTEGYFCSFFFFLDLISTVTIILDVDFITDSLFNGGSSTAVNNIVSRSKASRVAARGVRIVKIFRLARVAKLYKSTQKARQLNQKNRIDIIEKENKRFLQSNRIDGNNDNGEGQIYSPVSKHIITVNSLEISKNIENMMPYSLEKDYIKQQQNHIKEMPKNGDPTKHLMFEKGSMQFSSNNNTKDKEEQLHQMMNKESQISKILSEDTIKKIVVIILIIMISIPLLDISNYMNVSTQWDYMATFIVSALSNPAIEMDNINSLINLHIKSFPNQGVLSDIICIDTPFDQIAPCSGIDFGSFRTQDLGVFYQNFNSTEILAIRPNLTLQTAQSSNAISIFINYQKYNRLDSTFSIVTTVFVCFTIIYLLASFSNNIGELIINPIEKMLNLVKSKDFKDQNDLQNQENCQEFQTNLVQNSIIKIKILLEMIYGPLGNDLIQEKLFNNKPISVSINESVKKSFCILGICKIKNLAKITQFISEDVFGLFNQISSIVHSAVFRYGGYCTKILDDGFLIVFKVPEEQCMINEFEEEEPNVIIKPNQATQNTYTNVLSDFAVYSMLKILARLCKEPKILKYRNDQRLLINFGGSFNVEMNFALDMGWVYEGVIGSSYKIDPILFGQKINHLQKLLKICKEYNNFIIISQSLYQNLSNNLRSFCRGLDVIKFEDSNVCEKLYMINFDITNITASRNRGEKLVKQKRELKTKKQMNMIYLSTYSSMINYNASYFINSKKQLRQILRKIMSEETRKKYGTAFQKYVKGEWQQSQQILQSQKFRCDLPSQRLYEYMHHYNFKCPSTWKGYRSYPDIQ